MKRTPSRFVFTSAVITNFGAYEYEYLSPPDARAWLDRGPFVSAVRYSATAEAMRALLGVCPEIDRRHVSMMPGDEALVFRITANVRDDREPFPLDFVKRHHEIGLLKRVA